LSKFFDEENVPSTQSRKQKKNGFWWDFKKAPLTSAHCKENKIINFGAVAAAPKAAAPFGAVSAAPARTFLAAAAGVSSLHP